MLKVVAVHDGRWPVNDYTPLMSEASVPQSVLQKLIKAWERTGKVMDFGGGVKDIPAGEVLNAGLKGLKAAGLTSKEAKLLLTAAEYLVEHDPEPYR